MIKGLHHNAYRCRDSEETRQFYEDFLGLPLAEAKNIATSMTGRKVSVLHTFFEMADGSYLAFFEVPGMAFEFKEQHDYDLHIALEVPHADLQGWVDKAKGLDMEVRGIIDHVAIDSIYFRDPSGYVVELTGRRPEHDELMDRKRNGAREKLAKWQASKSE